MSGNNTINPITDLENQMKRALDNLNKAYYDRTSPVYRDNERYSWAVKSVSEKYAQLKKDLIQYLAKNKINERET